MCTCNKCKAYTAWVEKNGWSLKGFDEWAGGAMSTVEEKRNKCVVNIQRMNLPGDKEYNLDVSLGIIGILLLSGIPCKRVYKNKLVISFDFAKKDTKKIKDIEKAYLLGTIQVDAKQMAKATMGVVNHLLSESIVVMNGKVTRPKKN